MFIAPTKSAWLQSEHSTHLNSLLVLRMSFETKPYLGQVIEVFLEFTSNSSPPRRSRLWLTNSRNLDQP